MKLIKSLIIFSIFFIFTFLIIPSTYAQVSIEQSKDTQSMKIPYSVQIYFDFDENAVTKGIKISIGKYLKSAIFNYLFPALDQIFDQDSKKRITIGIKDDTPKDLEWLKKSSKKMETFYLHFIWYIYLDDVILYRIYTRIPCEVSYPFNDEKINTIVESNITEAVKKIPNEVAWVFLNPEKATVKIKEQIEWVLKYFGVNDPLMGPGLIINYIELANLSRLTKKYDEAIAAAKRAIEINPNNDLAYAVLGLIYQEQKKYKDAEENFKKAISLDPKYIYFYLKLANLYYEKESYNEAVSTLTKALEINPSYMEANYLLINTYMAMGQFDKAIESANKAIKYNTITGVGIGIKAEGDYPVIAKISEEGPAKMVGIEIGDKIIKVNNQSTKKLELKDVANLLRGEEGTQVTLTIKRGDKEFEKTITRKTMIDKKASIFFAQRSLCYREKGNLEQAMKDAEKAYSLNPNLDDTKEALGAIYIDKGKYDEAINILSSTNKDNNFSKLLLTTAYTKAGKFNEAVSVYKNIPEDYLITKSVLRTNAINTLYTALKPYKDSMMQSVKDLEAKGQYREAIKGYANLLKIADEKEAKEIRAYIAELMIKYPHLFALPEEARKSVIKAETYTEEGKFEKAIEEYQKALELSPFFPNLYKALALSYGQIKDYKKAIKNMNIYLELYPDAPDIRTVKDQIYKWEFMMEKGE
jgi:tetratricopeptide (TPR) repeat protein